MNTRTILLSALLFASAASAAGAQTPAANKQLILDLYREVFEAQNAAAVTKFYAADSIEHNPNIAGGPAGFIAWASPRWTPRPVEPTLRNPPAIVLAEGDLVQLVFERPRPEPTDPSKTYKSYWFELFRVRGGKVVEHWDGVTKPTAPPAR